MKLTTFILVISLAFAHGGATICNIVKDSSKNAASIFLTANVSNGTSTAPFCTDGNNSMSMGVQIERIKPGDGKNFPNKGDKVTIHYVGTFQSDGRKFDSSRDRGKPFKTIIGTGRVIKGWDEGIPQLSLGEVAKLIISYKYAYGDNGYPPTIPPKSNLIFEVELLQIN